MGAALKQRQAPGSERAAAALARGADHRTDTDLADHRTAPLLDLAPGVGPVAQEGGITGGEQLQRFVLREVGHRGGADAGAHQRVQPGGGPHGPGAIEFGVPARAPLARLPPAAAEGVDGFEHHAAQALVLAPLPDVAPAHLALPLQPARDPLQLLGGAGRLIHQIGAPVEQPRVAGERHAPQMAAEAVAEPRAGHHRVEGIGAEQILEGRQPAGGHVAGRPADIHQQQVVGGGAQQQAADRQIGHRLGVERPARHLDAQIAVLAVEGRHQRRRGIHER